MGLALAGHKSHLSPIFLYLLVQNDAHTHTASCFSSGELAQLRAYLLYRHPRLSAADSAEMFIRGHCGNTTLCLQSLPVPCFLQRASNSGNHLSKSCSQQPQSKALWIGKVRQWAARGCTDITKQKSRVNTSISHRGHWNTANELSTQQAGHGAGGKCFCSLNCSRVRCFRIC